MQSVKKIWKASGKRQAISRGAKENPRVSLWVGYQDQYARWMDWQRARCREVAYQLLMLKPVMQFAIWMMTSLPRLCILLVSLCQTWVDIGYRVYERSTCHGNNIHLQ